MFKVQYAAITPRLAPLAPREEVMNRPRRAFVVSDASPPKTPHPNQMARKLPRPTISCTSEINQHGERSGLLILERILQFGPMRSKNKQDVNR